MVNQRVFVSWLPIGIAITIVLGSLYAGLQQSYRQNGNDPQIAIAEDMAALLSRGVPASEITRNLPPVDIKNSLSTFVTMYDANEKAITSSGFIGSSTPVLPKGVLEDSRRVDVNKKTWQIASGERFAAVVKYWQAAGNAGTGTGNSGYILVARSLREIEDREFALEIMIAVAWVIGMVLTLVAEWFKLLYHRRYINKEL